MKLSKFLFIAFSFALILCLAVSFAFADDDGATSITSAEQLKFASLKAGVYKLEGDIVLKTGSGLVADDFTMTQTPEQGKITIDLNGNTLYVQQRINLGTASLEFINGKIEVRGVNLVYADKVGSKLAFRDVDLVIGHKSGGVASTVFDLRNVDFDFVGGSIKMDQAWNGSVDDSTESKKGTNGYLAFSGALFNIGSNSNSPKLNVTLKKVDIDIYAPFGNVTVFNFGTYKHGTTGQIYGPFTALPTLTLDECQLDVTATSVVNVAYGGHTSASEAGLIRLSGNTAVIHRADPDENDGVEGMFTAYSAITSLSRETTISPNYVYIVLEEGVTLSGDASAVSASTICVSDIDAVTKENASEIAPFDPSNTEGFREDSVLLYDSDCTTATVVPALGAEYVTVKFNYNGKTAEYKLPYGATPVWHRGLQIKGGYRLDGGAVMVSGIAGFTAIQGGELVDSFESVTGDVEYYAVYEEMLPYWAAFDADGGLVGYGTSAMLNATANSFNTKVARIEVFREVRQITGFPVVHDTVINLNGNRWVLSGAKEVRFNVMTEGADLTINGVGAIDLLNGRNCNLAYADVGAANLTLNGVDVNFGCVVADWRTTGVITMNGGSLNSMAGSGSGFSIGNKAGTANYSLLLRDVEINLTEGKDFIVSTRGSGNGNNLKVELSGCTVNAVASSLVKADPTAYTVTVDIKAGTKIQNSSEKYFVLTPAGENGTVRIAEGCSFSHNVEALTSPAFTTYFWDFDANRRVENCGIVETGWTAENEKYIVTTVGTEIVWHIGDVAVVESYFVGLEIAPPVDVDALPPEIVGDKLYLREFVGWATTEGGEVIGALPPASEDAHYYAVYESTLVDAACAIVDNMGFVSDYFEETSISSTTISGNPDGYTVVLLKDVTYDEKANINIAGKKVTIDLNGKTFTASGKKDSAGTAVGRFNMGDKINNSYVAGSLVIKNGKLVFEKGEVATNIVYCDEKYPSPYVRFENVDVTFDGTSAFEVRGGCLELFAVEFSGKQLFTTGSRYANGNEIRVDIRYSQITCNVFGALSSRTDTLYHPAGTYRIISSDVTTTDANAYFFEVKGGKANANPSSTKAYLEIFDSNINCASGKALYGTANITDGRIIPEENLVLCLSDVFSNCPFAEDGVTVEFNGVAHYDESAVYKYTVQDEDAYVLENISFDGQVLALNLYLDGAVFKSVKIGDNEYTVDPAALVDGRFAVSYTGIDVREADKIVPVVFTYLYDAKEYTVYSEISVSSYISAALGSPELNEEEKQVVFALLNYIIAAQEYFLLEAEERFVDIYEFFTALYDYEIAELPVADADTSAVAHAIYSAQIKLTDKAYLVLNLSDTECAVSVSVGARVIASLDAGHGESVLLVPLVDGDFARVLTITAGESECEYSAWAYLNRISGKDNARLMKLVEALATLYAEA